MSKETRTFWRNAFSVFVQVCGILFIIGLMVLNHLSHK